MVCTKLPDGPCTKASDGPCVASKTPATLPALENVLFTGRSDDFVMSWDGLPANLNIVVKMMIRPRDGGPVMPRQTSAADSGVLISHSGLVPATWYNVWYREQNATQYSPWIPTEVYIDPAWTSESVAVTHLGDYVFHGPDLVIIG